MIWFSSYLVSVINQCKYNISDNSACNLQTCGTWYWYTYCTIHVRNTVWFTPVRLARLVLYAVSQISSTHHLHRHTLIHNYPMCVCMHQFSSVHITQYKSYIHDLYISFYQIFTIFRDNHQHWCIWYTANIQWCIYRWYEESNLIYKLYIARMSPVQQREYECEWSWTIIQI